MILTLSNITVLPCHVLKNWEINTKQISCFKKNEVWKKRINVHGSTFIRYIWKPVHEYKKKCEISSTILYLLYYNIKVLSWHPKKSGEYKKQLWTE